jgi:hypothetical protein
MKTSAWTTPKGGKRQYIHFLLQIITDLAAETTQIYYLNILLVRSYTGSRQAKIKMVAGFYIPSQKFWGKICFQAHSCFWQNLVPSDCKTKIPVSLLDFIWGSLSVRRNSLELLHFLAAVLLLPSTKPAVAILYSCFKSLLSIFFISSLFASCITSL